MNLLRLATLIRQLQTFYRFGEGDPEGTVEAPVGALRIRRDGAPGTLLYQKQTGENTATGWTAIA